MELAFRISRRAIAQAPKTRSVRADGGSSSSARPAWLAAPLQSRARRAADQRPEAAC